MKFLILVSFCAFTLCTQIVIEAIETFESSPSNWLSARVTPSRSILESYRKEDQLEECQRCSYVR